MKSTTILRLERQSGDSVSMIDIPKPLVNL